MRPSEIQVTEDAKADPEGSYPNRDACEGIPRLGTKCALTAEAPEGTSQSTAAPPLNEHQQDHENGRQDQ